MERVVAECPGIYLVNGIPVFWLLGVLLITGLLGVSAGALHRFDVKLVYGRVFEKLDEIIADMEELDRAPLSVLYVHFPAKAGVNQTYRGLACRVFPNITEGGFDK